MSIPPPPPFGSNPPQYGQPAPPPGYPQPGYPQPGYGQMPPGYQAYQQGYGGPAAYAGFGARLGSLVIDGLISALFAVPAIIAIFAGPTKIDDCTIDGRDRLCEVPTGASWALFAGLLAVGVIAYLVIYCRMLGKGQSIGMKAVNIRIVRAADGQPIGAGRALGRWLFAYFISGNVCLLGFLWSLWDGKKQTWHDKVVGSIVVKA